MTTFGLLIFDEAEELDFCGPWEVFTASSMLRDFPDRVVLIAEHPGAVRCGKGMRVIPDHTMQDAPALDLLLVPGATAPGEKSLIRSWSVGSPQWPPQPRGPPAYVPERCSCTRRASPEADAWRPTTHSRTPSRPAVT